MYQVIDWLKGIAHAEHTAGFVEGPVLDQHVQAFTTLQHGWRTMNGRQFREVMTTAHFADYFSTALSREFRRQYEYQRADWLSYTFQDEAPDFRDVDRFRMTEPGTLYKRRQKGESTATSIATTLVQYGVDEYSRQFDVSWRAILNDDLGKIRETPSAMVRAARRFEDQFVSNLYDNATSQAALVALGAVYAGTGRLTLANLAVGVNAMMQRTDAGGNKIDVGRIWLVIPPILKVQAATILNDVIAYGGPDSNVMSTFLAGVKVDPYIATSGADVPWYLFAEPQSIPAVTVARLRGFPEPITFMKESNIALISGTAPAAFLMGSAETGDIEYFVETVIGGWDDATYVGITDYQGIYYSSGTTP